MRPLVLLAAVLATPVAAQVFPPLPLSPRNASYTIEAELDHEAKTLAGRQVVEWRNLQERPTDELWFHLYWNAFRNDRSTWMQGNRVRGRSTLDEIGEDDWGWLEVDAVRLLGELPPEADVELTTRYAAPDDGNPDDRTVLVATLPRLVGRGETIRVEVEWRAKIPRVIARTGFHGEYYLIAHWFPKLGVHEPDGWNCHQFHAATEFFSDYGVYDVSLTLPSRLVLGATGREIERVEHDDGRATSRFRQADVHGFAWTASPDFIVRERRFERGGLPSVDLRLLIQPEHLDQVDRHFDATIAALDRFGRWFGPYPYEQLTIVDPAWGSSTGGMEYPTLFTAGTRRFNPPGGDSPESVTIHEAGHQFWYGVVGTNEFEYAWLDEGLTTYSTYLALDEAYGPKRLVSRWLDGLDGRGVVALRHDGIEIDRWSRRRRSLRNDRFLDPPAVPTWRHWPADASTVSYSKTALWLATLERYLPEDRLREILSTYYRRHRFGHPTPDDFFAVVDELAGEDLDWFFDQVHRDAVVFDYAVRSVSSEPRRVEGWVEGDDGEQLVFVDESSDDESEGTVYDTEVVVLRRGEGRFPVDVRLVFEDGSERRERWSGHGRWRRFEADGPVKLAYAEVDPDRVLMLDVRRSNNARRVEPADPLPATKWAATWMLWLQELLAALAYFA